MGFKLGTAALTVVALLSYCYRKKSIPGKNSMEPPTLRPTIPFIGHIVNMMWGKFEYYVKLRYCPTN